MNRRRPHYRKARSIEQFDYEKMAISIVKAQEMAGAQVVEETQVKLGFFKAVWFTIIGKQKSDGKMTVELFSTILSISLSMGAIFVFIILLALFGLTCLYINTLGVHIFLKLILWVIAFATYFGSLFLPLLMRGAANEMEKEKDKYFITAVFSALTSMVALIVALI